MTTGSASFEGPSERKTVPAALLNSEIPSATWLVVGRLFPAPITILCGTSKVLLSTTGAGTAAGPFTTLVRSETAFGGRFELEVATGDCSSTATSASSGFSDSYAPNDP